MWLYQDSWTKSSLVFSNVSLQDCHLTSIFWRLAPSTSRTKQYKADCIELQHICNRQFISFIPLLALNPKTALFWELIFFCGGSSSYSLHMQPLKSYQQGFGWYTAEYQDALRVSTQMKDNLYATHFCNHH